DAKPFLIEISERSYLLKQISIDTYDFLHLSFQEYFTSLELKERQDGISIIIDHLFDSWWEETILLYAGVSKDASLLIKTIEEKKVPEDIFYGKLILYGKLIADAEFTEPKWREVIINKLWQVYQHTEFYYLKNKIINVLSFIKSDNIIAKLIEELEGSDYYKTDVIFALGEVGNDKVIDPLIKILTDNKERDENRWKSAYALGKIGDEKILYILLNIVTNNKKNDETRVYAIIALGEIKDN
ncbi:HEAT repeat domain-containing protein, partial [Candidatus Desantisbacteria bacterium]|nr:HEAT repeat domain-containing protein [Candidatus Desantisbacteria bacterium]